jgi:hypothetical protein
VRASYSLFVFISLLLLSTFYIMYHAGSFVLGTLESLRGNLLLGEHSHSSATGGHDDAESDASAGSMGKRCHSTRDERLQPAVAGVLHTGMSRSGSVPLLSVLAPAFPGGSSLHDVETLDSINPTEPRCRKTSADQSQRSGQTGTFKGPFWHHPAKKLKKALRSSPAQKKRLRKHVPNKHRSRHLIKSVKLKKLSPFSFLHHDDDGMSVATGRSTASTSGHNYGLSTLPSSYAKNSHFDDRNNRLHSFQFTKSFSNGHNMTLDHPSDYVVGYAHPDTLQEEQDRKPKEAKASPKSKNGSSDDELSSFNDMSSSDHSGGDSRQELHSHLMLILSSSGTKETISAHALLLPIIHILKAYRSHR